MQCYFKKVWYIFIFCLAYFIGAAASYYGASNPTKEGLARVGSSSWAGVKGVGATSSNPDFYPQLLKYTVKVNNLMRGGSGSGVMIWSGTDKKGVAHSFILTNRHVLENGQVGTVEIYNYLNFRSVESVTVYPVVSITSSPSSDLSLLGVLSSDTFSNVAPLISSEDFEATQLYSDVYLVGSGLGHPPFITLGKTINFSEDVLLINGFSVWGCSGGGVFTSSGKLISLARSIGMANIFGQDHAITNLSSTIPINIISEWLLTTKYKFIINSSLGSIDDAIHVKFY